VVLELDGLSDPVDHYTTTKLRNHRETPQNITLLLILERFFAKVIDFLDGMKASSTGEGAEVPSSPWFASRPSFSSFSINVLSYSPHIAKYNLNITRQKPSDPPESEEEDRRLGSDGGG